MPDPDMRKTGIVSVLTAVLLATSAFAQSQREIPVTFELKEAGFVTLVVEEADTGRRVRNLIQDTEFEAGSHTIYWDGYDQGGDLFFPPKEPGSRKKSTHYVIHRRRVAPGTYRVRGLVHEDVKLRYLTPVHSPGNPPWHTHDGAGAWLADHTPPGKVLFLPEGSPHGGQPQLYVCSAGAAETGHSAIWLTLDGRKLYGTKVGHGISSSGMALARDDGPDREERYYMYVLLPQKRRGLFLYGFVRDVEPAEGHGAMYEQLARVELPPVPDEGWAWLKKNPRMSIAVHNGVILVGCPWAGETHVFRIEGNKAEPKGTIDLKKVRGIAFGPQGHLFAATGSKLLRFDHPNPLEGKLGPPRTLSSDLEDPNELTLDGKGRVYVSQAGASHQVRVLDADGRSLRTIGKPGGLQFGLYDEQRMHNPAGIAVDSRGKLWVCEANYAPKRISVWGAESGEFDRAYYGPPRYGGGGHLDPEDRTLFYYPSKGQGIEYVLDYENQTSHPRAIYWHKDHSSGRAPGTVVYRDGHRYLVNCHIGPSYFLAGRLDVFHYDAQNGKARIIASLGSMGRKAMGRLDVMSEALGSNAQLKERIESSGKRPFVIWSDRNLDGAVQAQEVQSGEFGGGLNFDRDLSVITDEGWTLSPPRITEAGVPVWDLTSAKRCGHPRYWLGNALRVDEDTCVTSPGWGGWGGGPMTGWNNGSREWLYHTQLGGLAMAPQFRGQMIRPNRYIGFRFQPAGAGVGEMFSVKGYRGSVFVLTHDGLYVTDLGGNVRSKPLLRHPEARQGMLIDDISFNDEHFWPAINQMADGSIYLAAGKEFTGIFEVEGLDTTKQVGPYTIEVTPEMLQGKPEIWFDHPRPADRETTLSVALTDRAPEVDGQLGEWGKADWVTVDGRTRVEGAMMVHKDTLYAAWRTEDPRLLNNDLSEGWRYMFGTGGGLDLMIRTRPDSRTRRGGKRAGSRFDLASEGDVRLLITRRGDPLEGQVSAVRFQQKGAGPGESVEYISPVGRVTFDAVADVSEQVRLAQSEGAYELAVPFEVIGMNVRPGLSTRGDIGVLVGNGLETRVRHYWANDGAGIVSDIPSEAKLQPARWGILEFVPADQVDRRRATRAAGVLFDESPREIYVLHEATMSVEDLGDGAYSGTRAAAVTGRILARPRRSPFLIRQNPGKGEYRYLQLAWKPQTPGKIRLEVKVEETKVIDRQENVRMGQKTTPDSDGADGNGGGDLLKQLKGDKNRSKSDGKNGWRVERVDVWEIFKRPRSVISIRLQVNGGRILIDNLRLTRGTD